MAGGLQAGTPIGKYVVKRKLAEGGMAEIYLASVRGPEGFEKEVVIKRVRAFLATDPEFVQMFIAEARLASRLNHANVVQIFDFDRYEDTFYLAMEYVRGRSLWDVRKKSRERMVPMPPVLVAHIGLEVARGLHYAHRLTDRGAPLHLVHRDVTPHNVLLSWEGAIKLTDFGIAKAGNKLTSPGMLKGKFAYMSPAQARGELVDARTDVFALGVVLWEMLTGGRLFEGDSDVAVLRAVQQSAIAPPGRLNADVAPDLDAVVMKALARDPAERWQSAGELERALAHFILRNAQTVDETDLGAFLRALYSDELSADGLEGTAAGVANPLAEPPPTAAPTPTPTPSRREPTAVMPGPRASGQRPPMRPATPAPTSSSSSVPVAAPGLSPDEDPHASTYVPRAAQRGVAPVSDSQGQPIPLGTPKYVPPEAAQVPVPFDSVEPTPTPPAPSRSSNPALQALTPSHEPAWVTGGHPAPSAAAEGSTASVLAAAKPKGRGVMFLGIGGIVAILAVGASAMFFPRAEPLPEPPQETVSVAEDAGEPDAVVAEAREDAGAEKEVDAGPPPAGDPVPDAGPRPKPPDGKPPVKGGKSRDGGTGNRSSSEPRTTPAAGETGTGTLTVRAIPWCNVYVDGVKLGEVSLRPSSFTLAAGSRNIELRHDNKTERKTLQVRPGSSHSIDFDADISE